MKHILYLFYGIALLSGGTISSNAQMQYTETQAYLNANAYWAWYNHIGIDWSSGVPVYDSNRLTSLTAMNGMGYTYEPNVQTGEVAVSDPYSGELLFYAGGVFVDSFGADPFLVKIVNKNHSIMPNADRLDGNYNNLVERGRYIVPMPGDSTKYYVFSLGHLHGENGLPNSIIPQLVYSVVDRTLDNNHGDVQIKNILVDTTIREEEARSGLIAIPGNKCDVWLLTTLPISSDVTGLTSLYYLAYHITETGVNPRPVVSPSSLAADYNSYGLAVSPNRRWVLLSNPMPYNGNYPSQPSYNNPSELAQFDPETGQMISTQGIAFQLRNPRNTAITEDYYNILSATFSPDNTKLYTINTNWLTSQTYLSQFDLTSSDSVLIANSQSVIDSFGLTQSSPTFLFCSPVYLPSLKLYNDTIFMPWGQMNKIGSINRPNESADACEFQMDYFSMPIDKVNGGRSFNEVVYPMYKEDSLVLDTNTCQLMVLEPRVTAPYANYKWSTGETSSTITAPSSGTYWVSYSFLNNNCVFIYTDTFKLTGEGINPPPEITVNVDTLSTAMPYETYQWLYEDQVIEGETSRKLTVTKNGNYRVIVTNAAGCTDTSEIYPVNNTNIDVVSGPENIKLFPNPTRDRIYIQYPEKVYYQVFDVTGRALSGIKFGKQVDLSAYASGMYQLIILDKNKHRLGAYKVSKL